MIHFWYFIEKSTHHNYRDGVIAERPERVVTRAHARDLAEEQLFGDVLRQGIELIYMVWPYTKCAMNWQRNEWRNEDIYLSR